MKTTIKKELTTIEVKRHEKTLPSHQFWLKGGVGKFGETGSRSLEFENTQPEKICHFLTEPLLQHTRTRT